ncbi:MAG: hypothetical protein Q7R88_01425 [bacterium]|nr:hypothetical protein [bacterium]
MLRHPLKITVVFALCLLFRLLPFRAPNVEPILATQMPVARLFGGMGAFLFGFFSILLYDVITGTVGPWTFFTASAYGVLGLGSAWYFNSRFVTPSQSLPLKGGEVKKRGTRALRRHFVYFAIVGTLFYDAATGLTVGPLFFGQPFSSALLGQIPFTLMHLLGNVTLSLVWSPFLVRWLAKAPAPAAHSALIAINSHA